MMLLLVRVNGEFQLFELNGRSGPLVAIAGGDSADGGFGENASVTQALAPDARSWVSTSQ
jgi:hypothetical protein